jgi:PAS domain S-box-containing protein
MEFTTNPKKVDRIAMKHLPSFAQFILKNYFNDFIREQFKLSKLYNISLLKFFDKENDDEVLGLSAIDAKELLEALASGNINDHILDVSKRWIDNQINAVTEERVSIEHLTLLTHTQKQSFIHFIPFYLSKPEEILSLVSEIEEFYLRTSSSVYKTFVGNLENEIGEHIHFIEKINNTSPGIVYVFDLTKLKFIYLNSRPIDLYGYEKGDLKAMKDKLLQEVIYQDDLAKIFEEITKFGDAKDGELRSFDLRLRDKAGDFHWVRNYVSVFRRSSSGLPVEAIGIAINIQKEKETADTLAVREDQLLEAQQLADMGSFLWNLKTQESEFTPQVRKIFNLKGEESLKDFLKNVHPADRVRVKNEIERAINEQGIFDCEYRYQSDEIEKVIWSKGTVISKNKVLFMKGTVMDVTERHHIIQRLQRSDILYKQAQSMTHIGSWTWDLIKNKLNWSDELYRIYGLTPGKDIKFEDIAAFNHPDDVELVKSTMEESIQQKKPQDFYYRIILPKGDIRTLHNKGEVMVDENGKPFKLFGTVQDVTEQKLIEKRLRDNQNFIRKIADATPSIIGAYNIHSGKYLFINQAVEKILGYSSKTIFSDGAAFLSAQIHPDDLERLMEENNNAIARANDPVNQESEMSAEFQYRMRHADGTYRWIQTYGTVFDRNSKNEVEHVLNISNDITDRINAEKQIADQKHFIERIADASPSILFLYDIPTKSLRYVNNEVKLSLGYTPDELINLGDEIISLFHPDDANSVNAKNSLGKNRFKNDIFQYECRIKHKKNFWKWLLVNEIVFKKEDGLATQILGVALDISERKEMEEALLEKTFELQQSNASLEEFAYVASHDLKEPLRKISAFGDRLYNSHLESLNNGGKVYLEKIISAARRMQQMVDDLLSLSKITADKTFKECSLNDILDEVLKTLEVKIEEKNARITFDTLPKLEAVPSQMVQLFQNLLSNSLKFIRPDHRPEIKITSSEVNTADINIPGLLKNQTYLKISFCDNGIGFEPEYSERIFSIFQRLHGRSEYEGTGIGLAICRKIVENHGGIILSESTPGKGAIFNIYLPN